MHVFNESRGNILKEADGSASKAVSTRRNDKEPRDFGVLGSPVVFPFTLQILSAAKIPVFPREECPTVKG